MRYYQAVAGWFKKRHQWEIALDEILYVDGTVNAIRHALFAFSKAGDGVMINCPIYTPFMKTIQGTGRKIVNRPARVSSSEVIIRLFLCLRPGR